jgi:hypothetical protein
MKSTDGFSINRKGNGRKFSNPPNQPPDFRAAERPLAGYFSLLFCFNCDLSALFFPTVFLP